MTVVLLGDADDARGFRLAGVDADVCRTPESVERAVARALHDDGNRPRIVLVSESVYRLAPYAIDAARDRARWPIVVVLPEPPTPNLQPSTPNRVP